jgi:hypothetical protein
MFQNNYCAQMITQKHPITQQTRLKFQPGMEIKQIQGRIIT